MRYRIREDFKDLLAFLLFRSVCRYDAVDRLVSWFFLFTIGLAVRALYTGAFQ